MSDDRVTAVSTKNWTPAVLVKRPDNIISSDYARTSRVFTPSYERECRPCMEQLIANEYQRIWWQERKAWAKNSQPKSKPKKFHPRTEGSSHNVAPAKSPAKNLPTVRIKTSKGNVSEKTREKNLPTSDKTNDKR